MIANFKEALAAAVLVVGMVLLLCSPFLAACGEIESGSISFLAGVFLMALYYRREIESFIRRHIVDIVLMATSTLWFTLFLWDRFFDGNPHLGTKSTIAIAIAAINVVMFMIFKWNITPREIGRSIKIRIWK
jgi:hypothetical protein